MFARDLKTYLKMLNPALGGASRPILDCVHFTDGRMIATNLEATIEVACDLTLEASIPRKVLKTFLQTLSKDDEISVGSKDGKVVFTTPSGETELAGLSVDDRPEAPELGELMASAKVEEGFVGAFMEVARAVSADESRQVLTGVFVEAADGPSSSLPQTVTVCTTTRSRAPFREEREPSSSPAISSRFPEGSRS